MVAVAVAAAEDAAIIARVDARFYKPAPLLTRLQLPEMMVDTSRKSDATDASPTGIAPVTAPPRLRNIYKLDHASRKLFIRERDIPVELVI
jgi:hypothetical protein